MVRPRSENSDTANIKGKDTEEVRSKDEIIEALHERLSQLETENASFAAQVNAAAEDRRRIAALETTISQIVNTRGPNTDRSGGSTNPFASFRAKGNNLVTPTPMGPRGNQTHDPEANVRARTAPPTLIRPRPPPLHHIVETVPEEAVGV
ncbi:uncharacterized protein MELLADRAFT_70351 [Melampsora larici-populina 98AG31]|uniref:Uncharacterized protein n=1 Tax=Melampsora larici-populina (strain 98AG31 / pathotype 3-4-7) TaxID=747676 RepID=F4SEM7_MELLP|nr:uncharacterized protein MELLADRAFT_70351 [Melampsora larici-populina 98AG31]EGF96899.1 hypothetical protein MELLADRAFT_70351 [Melampsora larici-populina 98AG31]